MGVAKSTTKKFSLVDRDIGQARSIVVDNVKLRRRSRSLQANIDREARVMTDEAVQYVSVIGRTHDPHQHCRKLLLGVQAGMRACTSTAATTI